MIDYLAGRRWLHWLLLATVVAGGATAMPDALAGAVIVLGAYSLGYLVCLAQDYLR